MGRCTSPYLIFKYASAAFLLAAVTSCGPPTIALKPLPRFSTPPVERPQLSLFRDDLPVPKDSEAISFTLPLISAGFAGGQAGETSHQVSAYVLTFQDRPNDSPAFRVSLVLPNTWLPKLKRGVTYRVSWFEHDKGAPMSPAQGLVIQTLDGALLYLLNSNEAVPPEYTPEGLSIQRSPNVAFVTTLAAQSGCLLRKEHHFIKIDDGRRNVTLAPGEARTFRSSDGFFRVALLDYSLSSNELDCEADSPPHFTYVILPVNDNSD